MIAEKIRDYSRSLYALLGERRKCERVQFICTVSVSAKNRYGQLTAQVGQCLNLSDRGIAVECPEPIVAGSDVFLHSETKNLRKFAQVRHCTGGGSHYVLGCEFTVQPPYWN